MTTITKEQAKDLRNAFECWQQDYDPAADKEQYEMFGLGVVAMDVLLASLDADSDSNSHPAHGPLSNDRLHQIRETLSKAAAQSDGGNLGYAMSDAVKAIDELLEGRKAEPVADVVAWASPNEERTCDIRWRRHDVAPGPLYAAPPAPVVPATLPCAVELKPGLIIGKGCKTETLLTALQRRADYYAEIDAMTPEERAEHDSNIEAFKAMLPQPVPDERKAFETFMDKRFGDTIDQRRAKNGDQSYMAWDMVVAWIVWQGRDALLAGGKS